MEKLMNKEIQDQLREIFSSMVNDVTMVLFTKAGTCNTCAETRGLLSEVEELSDKIHLVEKDFEKDLDDVAKYNIEMVPSFVILDHKQEYHGVKFNGIPAGHEINSFIPALLEMSGVNQALPAELLERIEKIDQPINIKVFVTLSCPHCPGAVHNAHKLAMLNKNIEGEMIEAQTFMELSTKHNVTGVPKIVINDTHELVGNQPIEEFIKIMESIA
ncbi:MAG: glutaredoxin [Erysipelothrix sp.]|jgi:glutaredoxin-like protein|nr:glutaredoxin [Erysipelothrix sp.]